MKLGYLVTRDNPVPEGYRVRIKGGRALYVEAGSMWRERSQNWCFVSKTGEYRDRRYLPDDTEVELIKGN